MSDRLTAEFQSSILVYGQTTLRDLQNDGQQRKLKRFLAVSLVAGGRSAVDVEYANRLQGIFAEVDHVLRWDSKDFGEAFAATYGHKIR